MSNESFDHKIRAKFDDFEPTFQEQDWQNFAPILHPKVPFWLRFKKPMAYMGVAASIFYLMYQNNQLSIENKSLHSDNQAIIKEKQISQSPAIVHDTVYVHEIVERVAPTITATEKSNNVTAYVTEKSKEIQKRTSVSTVENKPSTKENAIRFTANDRVEESQKSVQNKEENLPQNSTNTLTETIKKETISDKIEVIKEGDFTKNITFLSPLDLPKVVYSDEKFMATKPERELFFTPSKIITPRNVERRFGVGISSLAQYHTMTIGLILNYKVKKRLEIGTGLSFKHDEGGFYKDKDDFRKQFKGEFKDRFKQPLPSNTDFTNIHDETKTIQLPVNVRFIQPFYRGFSAVLGTGALVNLHSTQRFNYLFSENGNQPKVGQLPLINENREWLDAITLSAGVQAKWKKFTFRAEPTILLSTSEKKEPKRENNIGWQTNIFYNF